MAVDFVPSSWMLTKPLITIPWFLCLAGLLLLLFPADRLLSSLVRLRSFESFLSLENSPRYRPWWWVPVLWLDPLRGLLGTWVLRQAFSLESSAWISTPKPAYWLLLFILGLAAACQTAARRDRDALLAPIGFVIGIVAALMPLPIVLIGFAAAATSVFAFRRFHAFFTVGLAMIALLSVLFEVRLMWLPHVCVVLALPIVLSLATGFSLELPTRNDSGRTHPAGPE